MGDSEEVMEFGKRLNMNPNEQKKYKVHLTTIRYNEQKVKAWKYMNYLWQFFFFGGLFIGAIVMLTTAIYEWDVAYSDFAYDMSKFIEKFFLGTLGFMTVIAFPLMMWTGVVRGKWEGKLTRSAAYALSFLENIEHRQYLEEKKEVRMLKKAK